jgi:hypothetical protein
MDPKIPATINEKGESSQAPSPIQPQVTLVGTDDGTAQPRPQQTEKPTRTIAPTFREIAGTGKSSPRRPQTWLFVLIPLRWALALRVSTKTRDKGLPDPHVSILVRGRTLEFIALSTDSGRGLYYRVGRCEFPSPRETVPLLGAIIPSFASKCTS